ncbi:MAG TPA: hypothetical protein VGM41_21925 [Chitinophagaceae bacterium]|jgi:hypothetical protein
MNPSLYILFVAAATGLLFIGRRKEKAFMLLTVLLVVTSANETWITVLGHHKEGTLLYNLFSLIEIVVWGLIFREINKINNNYFLAALVVILLASVAEIVYRKGFHTYTYRLFSLFAIFNCALYFYKLATHKGIIYIGRNAAFWIVAGVVIFQTIFLFYLTALDFSAFRHDKQAVQVFHEIIAVTNICYYCLLLTGLLWSIFYRH